MLKKPENIDRSQLAALLSLGEDIQRRAAFYVWVEQYRDYYTDLPTKFHIVEGAD